MLVFCFQIIKNIVFRFLFLLLAHSCQHFTLLESLPDTAFRDSKGFGHKKGKMTGMTAIFPF
jgi:hypothetical protein